jgi:predicted ArsR family transcriptional regulator
MPAKTHGERLDRLEEVVGLLAEGQISLEKVVAELATETRRGFDQVAAQFAAVTKRMDEDQARTQEHFRETARENAQRSRELDERISKLARENSRRSSEVDERIDKLVLAIGELIRNQKAPRA